MSGMRWGIGRNERDTKGLGVDKKRLAHKTPPPSTDGGGAYIYKEVKLSKNQYPQSKRDGRQGFDVRPNGRQLHDRPHPPGLPSYPHDQRTVSTNC